MSTVVFDMSMSLDGYVVAANPTSAARSARAATRCTPERSGKLVRWLFDNHLVDEITLLIYPVVVGQGTRLFPDTGTDTALDLVDWRATSNGITLQVYRPTGRPQYATVAAD